jgi:hypothetical protein
MNASGYNEDLFKAKLVGRYPSGAPLAQLNAAVTDPITGQAISNTAAAPASPIDRGSPDSPLLDQAHVNDFGYQTRDDVGNLVPRGAHIRRLNPRDQAMPDFPPVRTRRILRRGIPFGPPFEDEPKAERGLFFICYQSSIANQFEFLQQSWANDAQFPKFAPTDPNGDNNRPGRDPFIGKGPENRRFRLPGNKPEYVTLKPWVTVTGGEYFFSPSLSTVSQLATPLAQGPMGTITEREAINKPAEDPGPPPFDGAGDCRLEIRVAISGLVSDRAYPWRVWIQGESVWASQRNDYLKQKVKGVANGTMSERLIKALEALEPDLTVGDILQVLQGISSNQVPGQLLGAYPRWVAEVITTWDQGQDWVWSAEQASTVIPIDMGAGGNPK